MYGTYCASIEKLPWGGGEPNPARPEQMPCRQLSEFDPRLGAGCMRQVRPAGLQRQRTCHEKFEKLNRKVGTTSAFPMHIVPKK